MRRAWKHSALVGCQPSGQECRNTSLLLCIDGVPAEEAPQPAKIGDSNVSIWIQPVAAILSVAQREGK